MSLLLFFAVHKLKLPSRKPLLVFSDQEREQLKEKWASRKARASQFGAPVLFQEPPSLQQMQVEKTESMQESTAQEIIKTPDPAPQEEIAEQKKSLQAPIESEVPEIPKQEIAAKKVSAAQKEKETRTAEISKRHAQLNMRKKMNIQRQQQRVEKQQPVVQKNKKLTLPQLTQGFLEHLKNEGDSAISVIGDDHKTPTAEQLKHERYVERITWCLQKSYKINRDKSPATRPERKNMEVHMTLNKNGTIRTLQVVASSGIRSVDEFTLLVFKDASSSFPPVPNYLPQDPYSIAYIIYFNSDLNGIRMFMR